LINQFKMITALLKNRSLSFIELWSKLKTVHCENSLKRELEMLIMIGSVVEEKGYYKLKK
jgi:hypothetical protein